MTEHGLDRFPPDRLLLNPRILILGTFPGRESRRDGNRWYYMEKRNYFWPIMRRKFNRALITIDEQRQVLIDKRIMLWDMIAECDTPGSADSQIDIATARWNTESIVQFLRIHPEIKVIFNGKGKKAQGIYNRLVPRLVENNVPMIMLYQTSGRNGKYLKDGSQGLQEWIAELE